jgi:hypothetical protein
MIWLDWFVHNFAFCDICWVQIILNDWKKMWEYVLDVNNLGHCSMEGFWYDAYTGQLTEAVTLLTWSREVAFSNLGPETSCRLQVDIVV